VSFYSSDRRDVLVGLRGRNRVLYEHGGSALRESSPIFAKTSDNSRYWSCLDLCSRTSLV